MVKTWVKRVEQKDERVCEDVGDEYKTNAFRRVKYGGKLCDVYKKGRANAPCRALANAIILR
ncbi:MAG: hypothetical protein CMP47_03925 [Rickettsiales bacterium]|jgi:hypothetical protein|nr:hypothetical protein [Rickettsiales bacterium]